MCFFWSEARGPGQAHIEQHDINATSRIGSNSFCLWQQLAVRTEGNTSDVLRDMRCSPLPFANHMSHMYVQLRPTDHNILNHDYVARIVTALHGVRRPCNESKPGLIAIVVTAQHIT